MMGQTDRELLEYAAKAAGIELKWRGEGIGEKYKLYPCNKWGNSWNPLEDDGDSDRLSTTIQADIRWCETMVFVEAAWQGYSFSEHFEDHDGDKQKALRWARLHCAAEIGKGMP